MALAALSEDGQRIVFTQLCNVLDPGVAVALSSVNHGLWAATQALRQQLKAHHEVATALGCKAGLQSCKALREAKKVEWYNNGLTAADLGLLGALGSVLPALETLLLIEISAGAAGPPTACSGSLAEGLGAGALPHYSHDRWSACGRRRRPGARRRLGLRRPACRGSRSLLCVAPASATMVWWRGLFAPALRRLPAAALDKLILYWATRSATRASPPSWRRRRRQVRCRCRLEG